jgi:hypothetical protein
MKPELKSEIILYQIEDSRTRIEVRLENETVWLTQAQLSDLFQRKRSVITKHIRNIFEEGELSEEAVCADHARTAADGKTCQTVYYNLDVINRNKKLVDPDPRFLLARFLLTVSPPFAKNASG